MSRITAISLILMLYMLSACTATQPHTVNTTNRESDTETTAVSSTSSSSLNENTNSSTITPLTPYSTDGLLALNQYRSNNIYLNDFLLRNRKPDYFFSDDHSDYSYKKIYLIYSESENLYLFDPELTEHYKKFHPLPPSIRKSINEIFENVHSDQSRSESGNTNTTDSQQMPRGEIHAINVQHDIEKSLSLKKLEPYINSALLYSIPTTKNDSGGNPIYPNLYYLDKPLSEILENEYSAKYDGKKKILKLIFPKSYDAGILYKKSSIETRKIFIERGLGNGKELSLVVPDFLPGSDFYQTTHSNIAKVFSSLYQVKVPDNFLNINQLRIRYSIKLCQKDNMESCAISKNNTTMVRAIVIAATMYDNETKIPIETFILK